MQSKFAIYQEYHSHAVIYDRIKTMTNFMPYMKVKKHAEQTSLYISACTCAREARNVCDEILRIMRRYLRIYEMIYSHKNNVIYAGINWRINTALYIAKYIGRMETSTFSRYYFY